MVLKLNQDFADFLAAAAKEDERLKGDSWEPFLVSSAPTVPRVSVVRSPAVPPPLLAPLPL